MNGRMTGHVFQRTWETNDGQECHSWAYAIERGRVDGRRLTPLTREPYKTKKDAENALRDELSGRELGTWVEPTRQTVGEWFTDEWVPALTEAVAGLSLTAEDLLVGGKRVAVLERLFDVQRGLRARDDTLPT